MFDHLLLTRSMPYSSAIALFAMVGLLVSTPSRDEPSTIGDIVRLNDREFPGLAAVRLNELTYSGLWQQLQSQTSGAAVANVFWSKDSLTQIAFYSVGEFGIQGMPDSPVDPSARVTEIWLTEVLPARGANTSATKDALAAAKERNDQCSDVQESIARIVEPSAIDVLCRSGGSAVSVKYELYPPCERGERGAECLLARTKIFLTCRDGDACDAERHSSASDVKRYRARMR
jgi:hypothetical protein